VLTFIYLIYVKRRQFFKPPLIAMPVSLTPSHRAAVHKGFKRLAKAPPAGYNPEQVLYARQLGYKVPNNYRPGNGLLNSQIPNNITQNNANRQSHVIINSSGIKRRRRKSRKTRKSRK